MNKNEFLKELKRKLKSLPKSERDDAIRYYEEYFDDAQIEDDTDVLYELSKPSEIASQILAEHAVKGVNSKNKSIKNNISSIWFILLAIVVSPLAFPLAFPILITILVSIFVTFILGFVFVVVCMSLIAAGFTVLVDGLTYVFSDLGMALSSLGIGFLIIGFSVLIFTTFVVLIGKLFKCIVKTSSEKINKK